MYEDVCYGRSYLKQVVARIDFAAPLERLDKGPPARLVNPIAKTFPIIEPAEVLLQELAVENDGLSHRQRTHRQWNYFSLERDRQLTLAPTAAFIQYSRYKTYEEMKAQFAILVDAIGSTFPGTIVSRFGLRYVNNFDGLVDDPTDWHQFIAPSLVAAREFFDAPEALTRQVGVAELKFGQVGVRFQYGLPNPDYPAAIKRPLYVIDIDASVTEAHDLANTMSFMDEAHGRIQELFERSITAALREKMNVQQPVQQ